MKKSPSKENNTNMHQPKLAIISVIYRNYDVLADFASSLEAQKNKDFQLFLVDLTPKPQQVSFSFPTQVLYSYNGGYAHGVNIGLKTALERGFSKFCVINDDTYFESDFVDRVHTSLLHHPKTLIGAKIYYAKGYEYHKSRYEDRDLGKVLWYGGGVVDWAHAVTIHQGIDEVDAGDYDKASKTGFITGCLMCFDKDVVDTIGFWDEDYFLYFEDADYCERAKQAAISLVYDPSIVIWHKNAASSGGAGSSLHKKYQEVNRVRFGFKYGPSRTKFHLLKNYFFYLLNKRWPKLKD